MMDEEMIAVEVHCVRFDMLNKVPVVILKDKMAERYLPIWIGVFEATQIEIALEGVQVPRPMSHDLMKAILESAALRLKETRIHDIIEGTFHAKILLSSDIGEDVFVDARPSDAIALSLRTDSPIFVSKRIIENDAIPAPDEEEVQKFREFISKIKPADFKS